MRAGHQGSEVNFRLVIFIAEREFRQKTAICILKFLESRLRRQRTRKDEQDHNFSERPTEHRTDPRETTLKLVIAIRLINILRRQFMNSKKHILPEIKLFTFTIGYMSCLCEPAEGLRLT